MNALLDKNFLKELDISNNREIYAKITALDINDYPLELIEGKVTGGSINIDGASALRRTCSVSMIAEDININEFYWGLKNKFKLEIGVKNTINSNYPTTIWFPQGIYTITSFNCNLSVNNFTISINGKDKMCRLNGEFGGSLPASIDFGTEDYYDLATGVLTRTKIPIKKIIREMVHTYAEEPYHNIIINDLEDSGLELLEYRGNTPLYLLYNIKQAEYTQMTFDGKLSCYLESDIDPINLEIIPQYNKRIDWLIIDDATIIKLDPNSEECYTVSKVEYGQTAGYRLTDLTYAGDLISGIGESVTSILDKIINMLGNFEYFYDLNGRFVFQAKKTYLNIAHNSIINSEDDKKDIWVENAVYADKSTYYFNGNNLIKSISNTPNLTNVKNDYIIWGNRKGISGAEIPIHMRYAIHKKPTKYVNLDNIEYTTDNYDWRELIYQMALDYYKHNQEENYLIDIANRNPEHYPTGITGYESFYIDFQAFWRELYDPFKVKDYESYTYNYDDIKTFIPLNEEILYVDEQYMPCSDIIDYDRKDVLVLKTYNGELGLYNLLDTIPVNYIFDEDGKQEEKIGSYYIYALSAEGEKVPKLITKNTSKSISKSQIYIRVGENEYKTLIESVFPKDNWYIKKEIKNNELIEANFLLYKSGEEYNKYYKKYFLDIKGEVIETKDPEQVYFKYYRNIEKYYSEIKDEEKKELLYWNKNVQENPDLLNFWIDFLDVEEQETERSELGKMAISIIGDRPKVVNDKNVKSIYYRNIPNLIYVKSKDITLDLVNEKSGYIFMNITDDQFNSNCFTISSQGKSAKDLLNDLIYQHSYCTESINIQSIPIYYLEPNNIISIEDKDTNINGEYILNKITIPLTYNGMMSIQATKSPQRIY